MWPFTRKKPPLVEPPMPTEQAQKFLSWYASLQMDSNPRVIEILKRHSETREGRTLIAQSYIEPTRQRLEFIVRGRAPRETRRLCLNLENLIQCFPENERFNDPLMTLREVLIELYSSMSPNYESIPEEGLEPSYEGPRPTRFERLLFPEE